MIRSPWSTRIFAIYPTIESRHPIPWAMISKGILIQDTGRSSPTTGRSSARISLFRDRFWRSSKQQKDNVVRIFLGKECRSRISHGARYDKVARYLANEGERNKFRATNPPYVRNWMPYENSLRDLNMLLKVLAQVKLRFNFESRVSIDRIKLLVTTLWSKI